MKKRGFDSSFFILHSSFALENPDPQTQLARRHHPGFARAAIAQTALAAERDLLVGGFSARSVARRRSRPGRRCPLRATPLGFTGVLAGNVAQHPLDARTEFRPRHRSPMPPAQRRVRVAREWKTARRPRRTSRRRARLLRRHRAAPFVSHPHRRLVSPRAAGLARTGSSKLHLAPEAG